MKQLTSAFRELRKNGYTAKQNWQCCQNCGWHAFSDEEAKYCVFYHRQDTVDLRKNKSCFLSWSGKGEKIVSILEKHGIKVEWDGTMHTRIKITLE